MKHLLNAADRRSTLAKLLSLGGLLASPANAQSDGASASEPDPASLDFGTVPLVKFLTRRQKSQLAKGVVEDDIAPQLQQAMDHINARWLKGSFLGGGGVLELPAGRLKCSGVVYRNGVNIVGAGKMHTQLLLAGNGARMFSAGAVSGRETVEDNLFWGNWRDFAILSWESLQGLPVRDQVCWDAVGFSRWNCENVYFGWGAGLTAIRCRNAITADRKGPTSWYNSFFGCHFEKYYRGDGGVALELGDPRLDREQITTWNFFGGAIRGRSDGTGMGLRVHSAAGLTFQGVCFEGCGEAIGLGSVNGRPVLSVDFVGCYWEGNGYNWRIFPSASDVGFVGGFVTGGKAEDAGLRTRFAMPGATQAHVESGSGQNGWKVHMTNGGANRPRFSGSDFPSVGLVNDEGLEVVLMNGGSQTRDGQAFKGYLEGDSEDLFAIGSSAVTFRGASLRLANGKFALLCGDEKPEGVIAAGAGTLYIFLGSKADAHAALFLKQSGSDKSGWREIALKIG